MRKVISLLLAIAMVMSMATVAFAADTGFKDVPSDIYYADPVIWAVKNEVTSGVGDGLFAPGNICTRKEIATFLWKYAGKPEVTDVENKFTDVANDAWYVNAVLWAVDNGVTNGTGDGTTFSPDVNCTREQIVAFLYKYAGSPELGDVKNPFVDVTTSDWSYNAIQWAVEMGITTGKTATTFDPKADCSRAEIVTFLYRFAMRTNPTNLGKYVESGVDVTVTNGITQLFAGNLYGLTMTVENAEGAVLTYKGTEYKANESGVISVTFPQSAGGGVKNPVEFTIKNDTADDVTYSINFATPVGDIMNPGELKIGANAASIEQGDIDGYYFNWIATGDGTLTITMKDADWSYSLLNLTTYASSDNHTSADDKIASDSLEVNKGDEIRINVSTFDPEEPYVAPAGTVNFTAAFDGEEGTVNPTNPQVPTDPTKPEDTTKPTDPQPTDPQPTDPEPTEPDDEPVTDSDLKVGTNTVTNENEETTFEFYPAQAGIYVITAPTGTKVSYYTNYPFGQGTDNTNTVTWECKSENASVDIVVTGVSGEFTLTIVRTGDAEEDEQTVYVDYVNTHKFPSGFNDDTPTSGLTSVDVTKPHSAVLGSDGYYHLDSADGPILYVDFQIDPNNKQADLTILPGGTSAETLRGFIVDDQGEMIGYEFLTSHKEYINHLSSNKMYPLTDDLILFLHARGNAQGWFSPAHSPFQVIKDGEFDTNTAWMVLCCYVAE